MASNTLDHVVQQGHGQRKKIELLATKFSEKFGLSMFKKHREFCRRGLAHLDPTPIFKSHSDNYETPCKCFYKPAPNI